MAVWSQPERLGELRDHLVLLQELEALVGEDEDALLAGLLHFKELAFDEGPGEFLELLVGEVGLVEEVGRLDRAAGVLGGPEHVVEDLKARSLRLHGSRTTFQARWTTARLARRMKNPRAW